jgi:tryptophan synthase alpha chain
VVEDGKGFVYCVSSLGVTGMRDSFETDLKEYLSSIRKHTDLPLAIGFGVSTNEDVKGFAKFADGIIVGSAIVQKVEETDGNIEKVASYIKELSAR